MEGFPPRLPRFFRRIFWSVRRAAGSKIRVGKAIVPTCKMRIIVTSSSPFQRLKPRRGHTLRI